MFKKIMTVMFALVMSLGILAGCNLVKVNTEVYYSQIVAEVVFQNQTKTFTMKELLNAYNSYGYQYVDNGSTVEEAVKSTMDTMINRAILVQELKKQITLSDPEIQELWRETFSNVNKSILGIEEEIVAQWELGVEDGEDNKTETKPLRDAYKPFEATYELKNGSLVRVVTPTQIDPTPAGSFVQTITDVKISKEALKRYTQTLRDAAKLEGKTNQTDQELLQEEINRVYSVLEENKYISKFQEDYLNSTSVTTQEVVSRYKDLVRRDYFKYATNQKAYFTDMRSDSTKVYYHPETNKFLNVTHILVKLSAQQNAQIGELEKQLKANSITKEVYETRLQTIKDATMVKYNNEEGDVLQKSLHSVYNEVESAVNQYSNLTETGFTLRAQAFNDMLYKYNDDTGIMNRDFAYVVNLTDEEGFDNIMIPEFTNASRELHTNSSKGKGSISDLVFAEFADGEFGFHIIMNLGVVENLVSYQNLNNITWQALYNQKTQPSSNKSIFDLIYAELNLDANKASTRMNEIVATAKGQIEKIKLYEKVYESLWKK